MIAHGETVTRLRGVKVNDGYNGTRVDWTNPDRLTIRDCMMAPRVEDELLARGREGVIAAWTAIVPFGSDVTHEDRMETPYGVFDVNGDPGQWKSPYTGQTPGMTVMLDRVEG